MVLDTCMLNICCGCIPHFHLHLETGLQKNYYSSLHQVTTLGLLRYFFIQKRTFCVFPYICVYRSCSSLKLALSQSLSLSLSLSRRKVWHFIHLFSPLLELLQNLALFNETLGVTIAEYCACLSRVLRPQLKMLLS